MSAHSLVLDRYVVETLMADLVGHDHAPSAFLVYLAILAASGAGRAALSHTDLAGRTGLSKRSVQTAIKRLEQRGLLYIGRRGVTDVRTYRPLEPWRRA